LDELSSEYGLAKIRFLDEFDGWVAQLTNKIGSDGLVDLFYFYQQ
jgi:hypothetical protein